MRYQLLNSPCPKISLSKLMAGLAISDENRRTVPIVQPSNAYFHSGWIPAFAGMTCVGAGFRLSPALEFGRFWVVAILGVESRSGQFQPARAKITAEVSGIGDSGDFVFGASSHTKSLESLSSRWIAQAHISLRKT